MPVCLSLDIGTTTITALALDAPGGAVLATASAVSDANITGPADAARGRSEWDAERMADAACGVLSEVVGCLGPRAAGAVGIGVTGQQHGGLIVGRDLRPITPLINWQDRRSQDAVPGTCCTYLETAAALLAEDAPPRAGCTLAPGFIALTLFWMQRNGCLPQQGTVCFAPDYVAALLAGEHPVCDPTNGASSGLFDIGRRTWDDGVIGALGLPRSLFPPVREAGDTLGALCPTAASRTGLPAGLPVFVALGDHQAGFVGSVASPDDGIFVNVGTGAQVAHRVAGAPYVPGLETRPFPRGGCLLVQPGLSGGRSYALMHAFFRQAASQVLGVEPPDDLYAAMNDLAASAPPGADGMACEPYFAGTRADPSRCAQWTGVTAANFTPASMVRSLLEGMARSYREAADRIQQAVGRPWARLVGAGNGLRQNSVLAGIVSGEFGTPLDLAVHREEAAYGAALVAGVGAGVWRSLEEASQAIRYENGPE